MLNQQIATFEKVSLDRFVRDSLSHYKEQFTYLYGVDIDDYKAVRELKTIYDNIKLPRRATIGSAGYDFFLPGKTVFYYRKGITIPTGIRCKIMDGYSLDIYPKSGLGFRFDTRIANTVGIIDSDYYNSDNEGHIHIKLVYEGFGTQLYSSDSIKLYEHDGFAQGIFHEVFGATNDNDNSEWQIRNGGFGSTSV